MSTTNNSPQERSQQWYFKQLRLPTMTAQYEAVLKRLPKPEQERYRQWIGDLLRSEYEGRQLKGQQKRIRMAQFPICKRFEELERNALPQDAQDHLEALENLSFMEKNQNVLMIGNAGTGKSHVALATGIRACEKGYQVWFRTAAGLINELKESKTARQLVQYGKKIQKIDLLILDEVGYISFDKEGAELLFSHLALRYETKSTIVTTNLNFSEWNKIFQDQALTIAILDRLTQNALIINMNGNSYRRRKQ